MGASVTVFIYIGQMHTKPLDSILVGYTYVSLKMRSFSIRYLWIEIRTQSDTSFCTLLEVHFASIRKYYFHYSNFLQPTSVIKSRRTYPKRRRVFEVTLFDEKVIFDDVWKGKRGGQGARDPGKVCPDFRCCSVEVGKRGNWQSALMMMSPRWQQQQSLLTILSLHKSWH